MTHLILSDTRMGDPGAAALATALTKGALPRIEVLAAPPPSPDPNPHPTVTLALAL